MALFFDWPSIPTHGTKLIPARSLYEIMRNDCEIYLRYLEYVRDFVSARIRRGTGRPADMELFGVTAHRELVYGRGGIIYYLSLDDVKTGFAAIVSEFNNTFGDMLFINANSFNDEDVIEMFVNGKIRICWRAGLDDGCVMNWVAYDPDPNTGNTGVITVSIHLVWCVADDVERRNPQIRAKVIKTRKI